MTNLITYLNVTPDIIFQSNKKNIIKTDCNLIYSLLF